MLKYAESRKLVLGLIGLGLFSYAVVVPLLTVHGPHKPDPQTDYYLLLNRKEAELEHAQKQSGAPKSTKTQLAAVLWQNMKFSEAAKLMRSTWDDEYPQAKDKYDPAFVANALDLAGVYLDQGGFAEAGVAYERILDYESKRLPANDQRIGRDYNNLGLSYYMRAKAEKEAARRKSLLDNSLSCYEAAEKIFRMSPKCKSQLLFNMQNQAIALGELGEDKSAQEINAAVNNRIEFQNIARRILIWVGSLGDDEKPAR